MQAAKQYNKKVVEIFRVKGFMGGNVDPFLYMKKSMKHITYRALYKYDNSLIGNPETIGGIVKLL